MKTHYIEYDDDEGAYKCVDCKEIVYVYGGDQELIIRVGQLEHQVNVLQTALDNSKKSGR